MVMRVKKMTVRRCIDYLSVIKQAFVITGLPVTLKIVSRLLIYLEICTFVPAIV